MPNVIGPTPFINWTASTTEHPARTASWLVIDAVSRKAKTDWLALFAEDGSLEDPVGPSPFDPAGLGHRDNAARSAFWDLTVANVERFEFAVHTSHACGNEVANAGTITAFLAGSMRMDNDLVMTYRVDEDGKIRAARAYWEFDRTMATIRPAGD